MSDATTTTSVRLTNRQHAWLFVLMNAAGAMEDAVASRLHGRTGVAVRFDRRAVAWRIAQRRHQRAMLALTGWPYASRPPRTDPDPEAVARWWEMHRDELRSLRVSKATAAAGAAGRG